MKKSLKHIITVLLAACIMMTGSITGDTITVNAAAKYEQLEKGCTITMKVGETKRFLMTDEDGKDLVVNTAWKTSDKNIVSIETDFADERCITEYIQFTANAEGTAIIGGRSAIDYAIDRYNGFEREHCPDDFSITVKVTKPTVKMTAKQKRCTHFWRVSRKATCQRVGTKICKKCKLEKVIKKTGHKWETITSKVPVVTDVIYEMWINRDDLNINTDEPDATVRLSDYIQAEQLARAHVVETPINPFVMEYDVINLPEGTEDAEKAFFDKCHEYDTGYYDTSSHEMRGYTFGFRDIYGDEWIDETNTICEYCGRHK